MPENITNEKPESRLYDQLSSDEQAEAAFNLAGYLDVVRRIFERISAGDPKILTDLDKIAKLKGKR